MGLIKEGADREKHENVCEKILGNPYTEVHEYMDSKKGPKHREEFGHDMKAEDYIKDKWGDEGQNAFILHILADRLSDIYGGNDNFKVDDDVIECIKKGFENIKKGKDSIEYYSKDK